MKKILLVLMGALVLTSCEKGTSYGKLNGQSPSYSMTVQGENGDNTTCDVNFIIEDVIVDSLKISEKDIKVMCERACLYSDFSCKYPMTFKFSPDSRPFLSYGQNGISVLVTGSAKNAFGVEDAITTIIPFDSTYNVVSSEIFSI